MFACTRAHAKHNILNKTLLNYKIYIIGGWGSERASAAASATSAASEKTKIIPFVDLRI